MASLTNKTILGAVVAAATALALAAPASAGDLFGRRDGGSIKDAPVEAPKRRCEFSINAGGTSDYVFRGISQSDENFAFQGGGDATCGLFYAGLWGSTVDFGENDYNQSIAPYEVDLYAGIKPTWGPLTFDLGVIYYAYPGAHDGPAEFNYVEIKGGVSGTWRNFALGGTLYYSPDYFGETGTTVTYEGSVAYEFRKVAMFTPSISGVIGTTQFYDNAGDGLDYTYWNAGLSLGLEQLSFDFRYWDSTGDDNNFCGVEGLCDERFVFTVKVALP
jgi:uncharacterized protein (TIGR02001 family)